MDKPFSAYAGDEPYVFVCYAHEDSHRVYPEILRLQEAGCRLWYDEGISPGTRWSDELARALAGASAVLFFGTPASVASQHCQDEISFALDDKLPVLTVQFEEFELPPGLRLRLGAHQAIQAHEMDRGQFRAKLDAAMATWMDSPSGLAERSLALSESEVATAASQRWWLPGVLVAVVLALGVWWWTRPADLGVDDPNWLSVAVLPFRAHGDERSEALAAGVTETLTNALAGKALESVRALYPVYAGGSLKVSSYLSSRRFAGAQTDPAEIAEELGVRFLISGSVRMVSVEQAQVSAELVEARLGEQLWADSKTYAVGEADLEDRVAQAIGLSVLPAMPASRWWSRVRAAVSPRAYEHYVRAQGLQFMLLGPTRLAEITRNFEQACRLEPWFYSGHQHLLESYLELMWARLNEVPTMAPVEQMIGRLESGFPDDRISGRERRDSVVTAMRARHAYLQLDFERAETLAEEALRLEPNSIWGILMLAILSNQRGELDEALRKLQRAYDAGAAVPGVMERIASLQLQLGRTRTSIKTVDEALPLVASDYGRGRLLIVRAEALLELGETDKALESVEQAGGLLETSHPAASAATLVRIGRPERARALLALAAQGDAGDARNVLDMVLGYAALGEQDAALRWVRQIVDARHAPSLAILMRHTSAEANSTLPAWQAIAQELASLEPMTRWGANR